MTLRASLVTAVAAAATALAACDLNSGQGQGAQVSADATASVPAGPVMTTYVNRLENIQAPRLQQNFVGFQFDYPSNWSVDPVTRTSQAQNFIKVTAPFPTGAVAEPENFAVGHFRGAPNMQMNMQLAPQLMQQLAGQFTRGFPGFQVVDTGSTTLNGLQAYQMRFTATPTLEGRQVQMWGRTMIVPSPADPSRGALLIMLATNSSTEVRGIDDVGVRGQLPLILRTFRFTDAPAATGATASAPATTTPPLYAPQPQQPSYQLPQPDQGYEQQRGYDQGGYEQSQDGGYVEEGGKPE